ncbi:metallophosphoesterase [Terrarubrum flagellatum]|uniref:metallophosphoesterase n=1 Tax=Terrirubrum flagellatum TaxID=2895980 RepID=UPI003145162D
MRVSITVSRRLVLRAGAVATAAAIARPWAARAAEADLVLISLADLHSPYAQLPRILTHVKRITATAGAPVRILINGDVFERGNVVALRSNGAVDLSFLRALSAIAPVIVNLGNHETALYDDPKLAVAALRECGATVISNIVDPRTGETYAPPALRFRLGANEVAIMGVATNSLPTYRQVVRPLMNIPQPVEYAKETIGKLTQGARVAVVMSHAGVGADKEILRMMPARSLLIGGHDHLRLDYEDLEKRAFFHGGSWGNHIRVIAIDSRVNDGPRMTISEIATNDAAPDATLAAQVEAEESKHLAAEDKVEIVKLSRAYDLAESALMATDAIRKAASADVAFLNHTSFGDGLPAGSVNRYRFDSFLRFDGDVRATTVDGATLSDILRGANQYKAATLDTRTGDFVYANELAIDPAARYRIAANGWTTMSQQSYLGRTGLTFDVVPNVMVKPTVVEGLKIAGR